MGSTISAKENVDTVEKTAMKRSISRAREDGEKTRREEDEAKGADTVEEPEKLVEQNEGRSDSGNDKNMKGKVNNEKIKINAYDPEEISSPCPADDLIEKDDILEVIKDETSSMSILIEDKKSLMKDVADLETGLSI